MLKPYDKDGDESFTEGFFPTFEMITHKRDYLKVVYVHSSAIDSDGVRKLESLIGKDRLIFSDKAFRVTKAKENSHVLGVFKKFKTALNAKNDHLVMVNPSDMGNLGNAMRTLLAIGYHDLALIAPCADIYNPKTVRASMGALFHIHIEMFPSFQAYLTKYPRTYYPFVLDTSKPLHEVRFVSPCALVYGNEATGLPPEIHNENNVRIEQSDEVDSLNLTTSIAIGLYALKMQQYRH